MNADYGHCGSSTSHKGAYGYGWNYYYYYYFIGQYNTLMINRPNVSTGWFLHQ